MQYENDKPIVASATIVEALGGIVCVAGAFIGLALINAGYLQGTTGFALGLSTTLPTLVGGLLLIAAGRILRAVTANSNSQAEQPQEKS